MPAPHAPESGFRPATVQAAVRELSDFVAAMVRDEPAAADPEWMLASSPLVPPDGGDPKPLTIGALRVIADALAAPVPSAPQHDALRGRVEALRELSERATPGVWFTNENTANILGRPIDGDEALREVVARGPREAAFDTDALRQWRHDRLFAAAAVNLVRDLLAAPTGGADQGGGQTTDASGVDRGGEAEARYEKARAVAEAIANRWDKFGDTAGVQWLADQIDRALAAARPAPPAGEAAAALADLTAEAYCTIEGMVQNTFSSVEARGVRAAGAEVLRLGLKRSGVREVLADKHSGSVPLPALGAQHPDPQEDGTGGGAALKATQVTLGSDLVDITIIRHEGRQGVLFHPRPNHISFGAPGEIEPGEHWPVPGDVVLWVEGRGPAVAIEYLEQLRPRPWRVDGGDEPPEPRDPTGWAEISRGAREASGLDQDALAEIYNDWCWRLEPADRNPHQFKAFLAGVALVPRSDPAPASDAPAPAGDLEARPGERFRLLEGADTLDGKTALTVAWPDGRETVEIVSQAVADMMTGLDDEYRAARRRPAPSAPTAGFLDQQSADFIADGDRVELIERLRAHSPYKSPGQAMDLMSMAADILDRLHPASAPGAGGRKEIERLLHAQLYDAEGRLRFRRDAPLAHVLGSRITVGVVASLLEDERGATASDPATAPARGDADRGEIAGLSSDPDWAEQIARRVMGRHVVDVATVHLVAAELRYAEARGYTQGHEEGEGARVILARQPAQACGAERVRHVKRGTEYEVLGEAEVQISGRCTCPDGPGNGVWPNSTIIREARPGYYAGDLLVIYRDVVTGKLWCRLPDEFYDGRFVPAPPAATEATGDGS